MIAHSFDNQVKRVETSHVSENASSFGAKRAASRPGLVDRINDVGAVAMYELDWLVPPVFVLVLGICLFDPRRLIITVK